MIHNIFLYILLLLFNQFLRIKIILSLFFYIINHFLDRSSIQKDFRSQIQIKMQEIEIDISLNKLCQDKFPKDYSQYVFWKNYTYKNQQQKIIENDFKSYVLREGNFENYTFPCLKFQKKLFESNICAKIIHNGQKTFKCYDCRHMPTSIFCIQCFEESDHQGHVYQSFNCYGTGCCDCGDQASWDPKGFCNKHNKSIPSQQLRLHIDQKEYLQFIDKMKFCFKFFLDLYFQVKDNFKIDDTAEKKSQNQISNEKKVNLIDQFGSSLLKYLIEFNKGSLISNIMTSDLLIQKNYQFQQNNKQIAKKSILQILVDLKNTPLATAKLLVLIFNLFAIKQFKYFIASVYSKKCYQDFYFSQSSTWSSLPCQFFTNAQLVKDLADKKQLKPLKFIPNVNQIKDFQAYLNLVDSYFVNLNYILRLPQQSAQAYIKFYVEQGCLQSLAFHRIVSYSFETSIRYYKMEKYYLQKFTKILKILSQSKNRLQILQLVIKKLFQQIQTIYQTKLKDFLNQSLSENQYFKYLYLTHQISFALTVFTYFQCIQQSSQEKYDQDKKIQQLIKVLKIKFPLKKQYLNIFNMIMVIINSLNYSGLTLGNQNSAQQYNTYHNMTHNYEDYSTLSPTLYLFKILIKIYNRIEIYLKEEQKSAQAQSQKYTQSLKQKLFTKFLFLNSLRSVGQLIDDKIQLLSDDNSIYDRNKASGRLIYFLSLVTQATETDTNELIIAMMLKFTDKTKYSQMALKFYLQVLKIYKKINLKDFKEIVDKFFVSEDIFQKFIKKSEDIVVNNGKLILKQYIQEENILKKSKEQKVEIKMEEQIQVNNNNKPSSSKISSQINIYYFPSFKYKIEAMVTNLNGLKVLQSTNHSLYDIFSDKYIEELCAIVFSYIKKIYQHQGKIKQRQTGSLNRLIVQIIKIGKALKLSTTKDPMYIRIIQLLQNLHKNQSYLTILSQQIKMMIIQQIQLTHQSQKQKNLLQKDKQKKSQQLKNKLQQKKNKKLQKFKKNYQIYDQIYEKQLENIKELLDIQQNKLKEQSENQLKKCLICCQNQAMSLQKQDNTTEKSNLCLMVFVQKTDLYYQFIKGKQPDHSNSHLVFKTCGHYIHEACTRKANKNKQFICELCKAPINLLLPINIINCDQKVIKENIKIFCQEFQMKFSQLVIIEQQLNLQSSNKYIQPHQDQRSIQQKVLQGIINQIIFSFFLDKKYEKQKHQKEYFKFFDRKQINLYKLLIRGLGLKNIQKAYQLDYLKNQQYQMSKVMNQQNSFFSIQNGISQHVPLLLKRKTSFVSYIQALQMYIKQSLQNYFQNKKQEIQTKYNFDKSDFQMLKQLLNKLIYQQTQLNLNKIEAKEQSTSIQIIQNSNNFIKKPIQFYRPPSNFKKFLQQFSKCPNCKKSSYQIFICFICSWKGCKQCSQQSIYQHTNSKHNSNSIYISMYKGLIYYVSTNKYWVFPSIYQDYLGNPIQYYEPIFKKQKYSLNETKLKKIYKSILNYDIYSSIKYEQYKQKKHYPNPI